MPENEKKFNASEIPSFSKRLKFQRKSSFYPAKDEIFCEIRTKIELCEEKGQLKKAPFKELKISVKICSSVIPIG